jgi:succinate-semialdehyde dehydrogenase/glutarate-semialdehyde dehydrogenase
MNKAVSVNPANGRVVGEFPRLDMPAVEKLISKADQAFSRWKNNSFQNRGSLMHRAASILQNNKQSYAALITTEMGKTYAAALKEIEKCSWVMNYYAENAAQLLQKEAVITEASLSYVTFNPMGVILAVMPWNFPFYQVIRFAAPALMAGNVGMLKHASNVQGAAQALEALFMEAGFPENVFTNLNIENDLVPRVIQHPGIAAVTLTGSEAAGRSVATAAGSALKKSVLELGGSDAYIILEDADIDKAVEIATIGRLQNNGQTCIAAKRFIVIEKIYRQFLDRFTVSMRSKKMGDPFDENTFYGPLARTDLRDALHQQVVKSIEQGAELILGGVIPEGEGAYYPATILANVRPGMTAFEEELFGPVAAVSIAKDQEDAIRLANHSRFGLGAGVITGNIQRGEAIASEALDAGSTFVNHIVVSDPRLPFGGVKNSGYGRELSRYGIKEFVNIKTVWVNELK